MLTELLSLDIYRFFLLVARIGAAMMFLPGFSGRMVPARLRLAVALAICLVVMPVLAPGLPPMPRQPSALFLLLAGEATIGIFLGMVVQMLMAALHIAGTTIGFQAGLTNAFTYDPVVEQQGQLLTTFLTYLGVAAILATDLHHLMLRAVIDSYTLFQPGRLLPWGDLTEGLVRTLTGTFELGLKMAAPLMVFGLVFYSALGLLARLVPQMQVFFVALPAQVLMGLWLMMVSLPVILILFLRWFEDGLVPFLAVR